MTVTYTSQVATCRGFSTFLKLLVRWRGSIYKLVWLDLLLFLSIYFVLNLIYHFALPESGKVIFENWVKLCNAQTNFIPLSFVLGFYVSIVMNRWWKQYMAIPTPDAIAVFVSATIHGHDERGRVMRRTVMRYVCLCLTMLFTMISPRVKKRFPTLDHLKEAGLLQQSEKDVLERLNMKFPKHSKYWLPIVWASSIITRARYEGRIRDDFAVKTIIDELNKFRGQCGILTRYDNISVPLVYTQVVTLAVYSYFLATLMGHQWIDNNPYHINLYFPIFTTLQFFFYVGWLKVAESLINPFGDDDDDFEVNWMVDRNLQVSYLIVDEMHHEHPELVRDQYWDEVFPQELPYTPASLKESHPLPSTANIAVMPDDMFFSTTSLNEYDPNSGPIIFRTKSKKNIGSLNSLYSMPRNSSVSSTFKKFFHRETSRNDSIGESQQELDQLYNKKTENKPIIDQVIEEVDEQTTLQAKRDEAHPTIINFFEGKNQENKPIKSENNAPNNL